MLKEKQMPTKNLKIGPELEQHVSKWATESYQSIEATMMAVIESAIAWFEDNGLRADIKCPVHEGQIHGGEAQELRTGIEEIIKELDDDRYANETAKEKLQLLLDKTDARDSLAHDESKDDSRKADRFDIIRHNVLKAMGVKALDKEWSWITGELTERHTWMVAAREREHQRDVATRRLLGEKLGEQRSVPWKKELSPLDSNTHVSVVENKRRVTADSFDEKLKIGDSVTILEQGFYRRGLVCAVGEKTYDLVMMAKAQTPLAGEREEIRFEGWNAALGTIERVYREGAEELNHIPVAASAMRAVAEMVKGFRHLTLMQKEFPHGK